MTTQSSEAPRLPFGATVLLAELHAHVLERLGAEAQAFAGEIETGDKGTWIVFRKPEAQP
jgi:hypothetical protein